MACHLRNAFASLALALAAFAAVPAQAASNVIQYTYDATGNIVAIQRANPSPITVSGFIPTSGLTGTVVTISGTGFSATATKNAVTFNGSAAAVTAATVTALTVAVPSGATTGKVAVTVARNTATSAQDFVVTAPGVPTIDGFTPATGFAGTTVTVTGTNFNPVAGATTAMLNQKAATVSSVTTTTLAFAVPAATGSGRIRVTTNLGSAISAGDFIVPPGAIAAADIVAMTRLVADGPARSIGILATNKYGLLLFDGNAGDWLSVHLANFAINPAGSTIAYTIYKPDNTPLGNGTFSDVSLSLHLPQLPAGGTYAVLLGSGAAQISLDARLERNRVVPADGSTLAITRSPGQTARALIAGVTGEQKALMVSGLATVPANANLSYAIVLPSGPTFRSGIVTGLGLTSLLPPFTTTGTYPVVFTPGVAAQTSFNVGLLAGVALPPDGAAVSLAIANPGEGARLTFAATVGENLGLGMTGLALSPLSVTRADLTLYKPDGAVLASGYCYSDGTECAVNLANLPVSGIYSVIAQPASGATGTMKVWLSHDVTGTLVSGTPTAVTLARPGQNGRLTFAGTAGQALRLSWSGVAISGIAGNVNGYVRNPNGATLAVLQFANGVASGYDLPALPATGSYTVFIDPPVGAAMNATLTLTAR